MVNAAWLCFKGIQEEESLHCHPDAASRHRGGFLASGVRTERQDHCHAEY